MMQTVLENAASTNPLGRRMLKWIARGVLVLAVSVFALVAFGVIYESILAGGDAARFPAPGQMVAVGDVEMHIHCVGEGSPTVIFEAGFGAWSDGWTKVQPVVGTFTRACSYDRAGLGWSETSTETRTPEHIATELYRLLVNAGVQPPYVLVGHSLGGKSIRLFADMYPEEVSGLVFVDAQHESAEPIDRTPEQNAQDGAAYEASFNLHRTLRQIGVARLLGLQLGRSINPALNSVDDETAYRLVMFGVRETTIQTMIAESAGSMDNDHQLRAAQLPDALPVIVLTADSSLAIDANWEKVQGNLAALSNNSLWNIVENSGHNIQDDQPEAVISAVQSVIEVANSGQPLSQ